MKISKDVTEQAKILRDFCLKAQRNDVESLKKLIEQVDVNTPFTEGVTALHYACRAGSMEDII